MAMQEPIGDEPVELGVWTLPSGRQAFAWLERCGGVSLGWDVTHPLDDDLSVEDLDYFLTVVHSDAQLRAHKYQKGAC